MMKKYIALLRGVNVGGKNKIVMSELKAAFEKTGFSDVVTYINSGNVIFRAEHEQAEELGRLCQAAIFGDFGLEIPVAVFAAADLKDWVERAPEWWDQDAEAKHNAIFVIPPATAREVMETVGEAKPEYERIGNRGQLIFWTAPLKTFSRTRWSKAVATPAYDSITIRNANTTKKLAQMASEQK